MFRFPVASSVFHTRQWVGQRSRQWCVGRQNMWRETSISASHLLPLMFQLKIMFYQSCIFLFHFNQFVCMLTIELRVVTASYMMSTKLSLTESVYFLWYWRRPGQGLALDLGVCRIKNECAKLTQGGKIIAPFVILGGQCRKAAASAEHWKCNTLTEYNLFMFGCCRVMSLLAECLTYQLHSIS